ncbi:biotin--[acetyl-CoA-carboxylase] ligase [Fructobacillus ficulneus]|uniref:Bifunctional ligase/repressor BirA n=1 Tax=Fructobacillus ficulneus TaxID=157463 RepID=A0A0K8MIU5_9LACO|nr:biotin--[acetyl-CoA-carboxylase] ligase [Fructobacillus ficulneus]GAP00472.1 biotin--[acetyl-CoA-carboxylase] ligase [Fructobacillus ficulneus]
MTTTKEKVLAQLLNQAGRYLSGDDLAQTLGLSRESVWKAIQSLKKDGHKIDSKKKTGYAYLTSQHLNRQTLIEWLSIYGLTDGDQVDLHFFDQINSTQTVAKDYIAQHPSLRPQVFVARQQGAGYGRQGRAFYSPKDRGLYVSVVFPVEPNNEINPSLLTTSAAVALVDGLETFFPTEPFQLKWVNDLILHGHKVGGVITEGVFDFESRQYSAIVVGFAINLLPGDYPSEIENKAQSILTTENREINVDFNLLLTQLLQNLVKMFLTYQSGGYLSRYRQLSLLIQQVVTVQVGTKILTGTVTDISDQGGLVLKLANTGQSEVLYAGEVTKVKLFENLNL